MVDVGRAKRLGDRIKEIVAEALELRVKDPRLGFVTVTDVRVSPDLHDATVFYTVYGSADEAADTAAALESAKGVLRSEVGKRTGVKFTPTLAFVQDVLGDSARHIEELIDQAAAADREVAQKAASSSYAGEADPYRHDEDEQ